MENKDLRFYQLDRFNHVKMWYKKQFVGSFLSLKDLSKFEYEYCNGDIRIIYTDDAININLFVDTIKIYKDVLSDEPVYEIEVNDNL